MGRRVRCTPGAWKVHFQKDTDHPSVYSIADGHAVLSSGHARARGLNERIANCTMAAAAPDMLKLLQEIESEIDMSHDAPYSRLAIGAYLPEIRSLIEKATTSDLIR